MDLKRVWYISICPILISLLIISGCSSTKELFVGNWSALQASQKEGTNEELINNNYWEVKDNEILFSNFVLSSEDGIKYKKKYYDDNKKKYEYTWSSKDEIVVNKKIYKVEIIKNKLTISNENIEMIFERVD